MAARTENSFHRKKSMPGPLPLFYPLHPTKMTSDRGSLGKTLKCDIKGISWNKKQQPQSVQKVNSLGWRQEVEKIISTRPKESRILLSTQDWRDPRVKLALSQLLLILPHWKEQQAFPSFLNILLFYPETWDRRLHYLKLQHTLIHYPVLSFFLPGLLPTSWGMDLLSLV